jgi:shikimate dehydrogenase
VRRLAVLGQPISHSRSPAIQTAALEELGLAGEWSYEAIEVSPSELSERVRAMPDEGFVGANVTVPHKVAALGLADDASEAARAIGAANTLSFRDGRILADNTDAGGLLDALPEAPEGGRALVLGAGGAGRAAVWALVRSGAEVSIWNRTPERARQLAEELGGAAIDPGERLPTDHYQLIVNATSAGMGATASGTDQLKSLHLDADGLDERHVVVDLAYGSADTELVRAARTRGATVVDGFEVLVRQGAASLRIWTGAEPPLEVMRRAAKEGPRGKEWPTPSDPDT